MIFICTPSARELGDFISFRSIWTLLILTREKCIGEWEKVTRKKYSFELFRQIKFYAYKNDVDYQIYETPSIL